MHLLISEERANTNANDRMKIAEQINVKSSVVDPSSQQVLQWPVSPCAPYLSFSLSFRGGDKNENDWIDIFVRLRFVVDRCHKSVVGSL